jgi:hypothetical protein
MLRLLRRAAGPLCLLAFATLSAACADSSSVPTSPDRRPLFESGPGSGGDGSGGEGSGGGGGTTPTGAGSVQIAQGGTGQGTITSEPAGINCFIGDGPSGPCAASFPAGTRVRLEAREAPGSQFRGWALTTSCQKAPDVTVVANAVHSCQPVFQPK